MHTVQLVTYPDSIGGSLKTLAEFLDTSMISSFPSGLHILPPYPSSGDRGFAPITYEEISPVFGSWTDIERLTDLCPVTMDIMVNHLSRKSAQFSDVLVHGTNSIYAQMFLSPSSIWKSEQVLQDDLKKRIFLRREKPYSTYQCRGGNEQLTFWTTFGSDDPSEQIDLDVNAEVTRTFYRHLMDTMEMHGISCLRLDAVGYAIKKQKTSCFFVEPEIMEFIAWLKETATQRNIEILAEVHAPLPIQHTLARAGIPNYDFASPLLILDALIHHDATPLCSYLRNRPPHMITMLDCHDGIPVFPDVQGLITEDRVVHIVDQALANGANLSTLYTTPESDHPIAKVHQINSTYLSALAANNDAMICARAIQMFMPGRPQVYYVGLFGGLNDEKAREQQGDRRAVNRKNYTMEEISRVRREPIVSKQLELVKLRNSHPAFQGNVHYEAEDSQLHITWETPETKLTLSMDLSTYQWKIF